MNPHDTTLPPACADDAALEAIVSGTLAPDREVALEAHLGGCAACRGRLDALAASPESWSTVREQLSAGAEGDDADAVPPIPALATLIQKILAPSDDDRMLGRLGPYEITGIIGSGGMGIVLKGHDRALDRFVAIKLLSPHLASSGAARQRFLREAKAAAAVVHDNVIAIHGVDEFAGLPYLVMPYCRGTTLEKRVRDAGPMSLREILRVGLQTARGLAAAHAQGLVHRDVKPANILLDDGVERVLLTDFGLARAADDASLTVTGLLAGTPHYMSPEQALGKPVDARSDLFALGAVLFTMATGKPPFRAESSHAVLRMVTDIEPTDVRAANPDLPAWFAGLTRRLLAKDPAARYPSATEVAAILEACLAHVNDPLAKPLPAAAAALLAPMPDQTSGRPRSALPPSTVLARLRDLMSDQRLLSIAALVIFLMALLLPWPIMALGRAEPAIIYAVIASLTSLLFAWLGRRDSLGRLVLKLAGAAAILGGAAVAFPAAVYLLSDARPNAERVAAITAQNLAKQAQMEAIARQQQQATPVPVTIPVPAGPRVATGPDPMPIVTWPRQPSADAPQVLTTTVLPPIPPSSSEPLPDASVELPLLPEAVPPLPDAPIPPRTGTMAPMTAGDQRRPYASIMLDDGQPIPEVAPILGHAERVERFLAEHPLEAIADVTMDEHRPGMLWSPDRMAIGPDMPFDEYYSRLLELLRPTTLQRELATAFLGRPVTAMIKAPGTYVSTWGVHGPVLNTAMEEGDGFQQQIVLTSDPQSGAILRKERRIRFTLDGRFRTIARTIASDFYEVAPGVTLPTSITIEAFDIDPSLPENAIPKRRASVRVEVIEWRFKEAGAPSPADTDADAGAEATPDVAPDPALESTTPSTPTDDAVQAADSVADGAQWSVEIEDGSAIVRATKNTDADFMKATIAALQEAEIEDIAIKELEADAKAARTGQAFSVRVIDDTAEITATTDLPSKILEAMVRALQKPGSGATSVKISASGNTENEGKPAP